uniref:Uncharacterized protein n=1 Tax=Arundo donax TaxID=35708 RepID=A0A0A9HHR4_ARUDO
MCWGADTAPSIATSPKLLCLCLCLCLRLHSSFFTGEREVEQTEKGKIAQQY